MIPNHKQSCIKFNLDFNKQYENIHDFNSDIGTNCGFCHNYLDYNEYYKKYTCTTCKYGIVLIHRNNRYQIYQIQYKDYCVQSINSNLYIKHVFSWHYSYRDIHYNGKMNLQDLLNKINMITLNMIKTSNDPKL